MERKLTAILSADVEGYSRLMGEDEEGTVMTLSTYREAMSRLIEEHKGRVVDSPGDNLLAEFTSAVNAVRCAVVIQGELRARNVDLPEDRRMNYRIGINLGDVLVEGDRIYGDGVNVAARVESLAEGGGISVSGTVYDQVASKLSYAFDNMGEHSVKNIAEPVRVYAVRWDEEKTSPQKDKSSKRGKWIAVVVVVIAAIAFIVWRQVYKAPKSLPETEIPSIAVLPFRDMSPDKDQEYFCEGMAEEILNALAQIEGLRVAARTSSFLLRNEAIASIGEQLNVGTVLEGSVRKSGNILRITAQLVKANDSFHLWSETYDRELKDVFVIQDEISQSITQVLHIKLMGEAGVPLVKTNTENIKAYDHNLQGRYHLNQRSHDGILTAIDQFEKAIALDPNYALAYSGLAEAYQHSGTYANQDWLAKHPDWLAKSDQALEKALALDPNFAEAHTLLGFNKRNSYDLRGAEKEFQLAIELKPEFATTHHWYSMMLSWMGRFDEALREGKRALELDPIHIVYNGALAALFQHAGQDDAAISQYQRTISLFPERPKIQWFLNTIGVLHLKAERIDEAVEAFGRWSEQNAIAIEEETIWLFCKNVIEYRRTGKPMPLPPELEADPKTGACFIEFFFTGYSFSAFRAFNFFNENPVPDSLDLAHLYAIVGQSEKALESLEQALNELDLPPVYVPPQLYAMMGEKEKALEGLEFYYKNREMLPLRIQIFPAFDSIRSEPRYIELVKKVGLEE